MAQDFSFLRLSPSFAEAKSLGDPINSDKSLWQHNQVCLLPTETYLQITNTADGIAFDGDYRVEIIDCAENVLADITDSVGIEEFTDRNGLEQLAFEIAPLGLDFYSKMLFLRFTHTTGDEIWYSTPFVLSSDHERNSSRFDYKGYGYFNGISYDRIPFYQSIRLKCYYSEPDDQIEVDGYNQISRTRSISSNMRIYTKNAYKIEYSNTFSHRRLQVLFAHDVKFIDGVCISDKPTLEKGDRLGNTNFFTGSFTAAIDYDETYTPVFQIIEPLTLASKSPFGIYTLAGLPLYITGSFNKVIHLGTGTIKLYESGVLQATYDQTDILAFGYAFTLTVAGYVTANGNYTVELSPGLFLSGAESSAAETWDFMVSDGEYEGTEYDNDYLID